MKKIISIVTLLLLFTACQSYGEKEIFKGTEVYYKEGITEEQVERLGESLIESGFANGDRKSVQFSKDPNSDKYIFKMVIDKKKIDDASLSDIFNIFPRELSDLMDLPIDLHLCNNTFKTLRVHKLEDAQKTTMALETEIRYTKNVTEAELTKLKEYLINSGFSDRQTKKTVAFDKKEEKYILKMVLNKGMMARESTVGILKAFKQQIQEKVLDGKPLEIHMCNTLMNTLKVID